MRVNVYNEELTGHVEPTAKLTNAVVFKGIGCFVCFKHEGGEKQQIKHTEKDDWEKGSAVEIRVLSYFDSRPLVRPATV
jgi:hypothetical protein